MQGGAQRMRNSAEGDDRQMRLIFTLLISILVIQGCHSGETARDTGGSVQDRVEQILAMEIEDVDPSGVPDGEYTGEVPFMSRVYRARVTVRSGRISDIKVLENGTGNKYARKGLQVVPRMIRDQSPRVDAVTGATVTSKALMKCVEKALKKSLIR